MLAKYSLIAVNSADDRGLLREATSTGRYNLHIQRTIYKSYGDFFWILRRLSFCRVNIMHEVFVSYIRPTAEFVAVLWFSHTVLQLQRVELVKRLFIRIIYGISSLSYERRLLLLKMRALYIRVKISKFIILYK